MNGPERPSTHRVLALTMLAFGVIGHLAWLYVKYGDRRPFTGIAPGLALLSIVSIACWAVLLVRPGRTRVLIGVGASLLAIGFVTVTETSAVRRAFLRKQARAAERSHNLPRLGEALVLPSTLVDIDGSPFDVTTYQDRPMVLNIWRTWCGPCRKEMPDLQRLEGRPTSLGALAVIAVSDEPVELLRAARAELGVGFRFVRHEEGGGVLDVDSFPTTLVLHKGRVIDRWVGLREDLTARVETAIEKAVTMDGAVSASPPRPRTASPR